MDDDADPTEPLDEADPTEALGQPLAAATAPWARASQSDPTLELRAGVLLRDRYLLGEPLARGGQAVVFRAQDLRRDPETDGTVEVAIKVLRDDRVSDAAVARLRREFRQTQSLQHPGALRMFDLDCERGAWFLCMELLRGVSLRTRLNRVATQPLEVAEALRIASACADVLACAHGRGIPHGDVKPSNVFLEEDGGIRLLDFGAAYDIRPAPPPSAPGQASRSAVATRAYASPEVLGGLAAEPRDDVFSLACVTYEMLAGRHPFGRLPADEARARAVDAGPLPVLLPAQQAALVHGLAWSRAERPGSVEAWIEAVLRTPDAGVAAEAGSPVSPNATTTRPRRRVLWIALAAALALGAFAAWYALFGGARGPPPRVADRPAVARPAESVTEPPARRTPDVADAADAPAIAPVSALPATAPQTVATADSAPASTPPPAPPARRNRARIEPDSPSIAVSEKAAAAVVVLRRSGEPDMPVTVTWRLVDGSARAGEDYLPTVGARTRFQRGQDTRAIYVPLVDDGAPEAEEFFSVVLSSTTAGVDASSRVTITIRDDD